MRKRAVLHAVLRYAVEAGLLEANPLDHVSWHSGILRCRRPGLAGFFGCL